MNFRWPTVLVDDYMAVLSVGAEQQTANNRRGKSDARGRAATW